jgi:4-amino-4-deoxy-L-arabinose transferase-like glycosyltransferase
VLKSKIMSEAAPAGKSSARMQCRFLLILLIGLALRLAVIPLPNFENLMDADHIHAWEPGNMARSLVAGRGFGSTLDSTQPSAMMSPVYPLIVAVFFHFFGVHTAASIFAVHAFDCLTNSLACIPIFLLARRSFGKRAAWWAAWIWAFFPYGIYFSAAWAWSTHLLLLCLCWLLVLVQRMEQSSRFALWAGFGLLAGFAGLTEPSVLIVVLFLLALACWRLRRDGKRWFAPGCVACLVMAAAISPWIVRNALVFHRFIPMRDNMGLEVWMGNNGYDLRWTSDDLHPLHDAQELADYNSMGELAYNNHKMQQAKAYIHGHRAWYAWMSLRRAVYIWTSYWSFDPNYLELEPMDPANIPFATCLTLVGFLGLLMAWRDTPFESIRYAGVLFLFPVMYYFTHPEPYHLRPLDPLLLILGCQAILALRERMKARTRKRVQARDLGTVGETEEAPAED